jgi:hypothetical protein
MHGGRWLDNLSNAFPGASAITCLGDYTSLRQSGMPRLNIFDIIILICILFFVF